MKEHRYSQSLLNFHENDFLRNLKLICLVLAADKIYFSKRLVIREASFECNINNYGNCGRCEIHCKIYSGDCRNSSQSPTDSKFYT